MKLQVKFSQEQIEEALKEIILKKFKNDAIRFESVKFDIQSNDFALNRGPDKTSATFTIEI